MRTHRDVATIVWAKCAWGLGGAITLMLTVFGQRVYPLGGSAVLGMAIFYAARGVGTALGPLAARRWVGGTAPAMGRAMDVSFPVAALFYLGFGSLHSLPLATLCVIGAHIGGAVIWVFSTVLLQASVPHAFQGRVFAAELGLFTLSFSISTGVYGRLADAPGADLFALVRSLGWIFLAGGALWSLARRRWPVTRLAGLQAPAEREQGI
jgi:hypothetical protein